MIHPMLTRNRQRQTIWIPLLTLKLHQHKTKYSPDSLWSKVCFKCQQCGHGARTCRATEDICPLCSGTHKRDDCPNKESPKCPNCDGAHPATSRECPAFLTEKKALEIQVESHCTLPAAREQAGQTVSAKVAVNSCAQILANSQADLVNRNLALSDENARLREVITTLRQDNAYLKQRLDGYEQRLKTLEQTIVGGAHPDTPLVGVQNTTPVGSAHNTTPVGEAHKPPVLKAHMALQTESAGTAGPRASMSPAQTSRIEGPRDAPSYIPNQSPTPRWKLELRRKGQPLSQWYHHWQRQHHSVTIGKAKWLNNQNHNGCHNSAMECQRSAM